MTDRAAALRRGPAIWPARLAALLLLLLATCAATVSTAAVASAHPISSTAVLLDIGPGEVTGEIELPVDRLAVAFDEPFTAASVLEPATLERLHSYVAEHLAATDTSDGAAWDVQVTGGTVAVVDGVDHLILDTTLQPPSGTVHPFTLHYDGIVERIVSHRVLVLARPVGDTDYTAVGLIDWQSQDLQIPVSAATTAQGFMAAIGLGVDHISEGADHLLFLLMLLLPAPLIASRGRWVRSDNLRRSSRRVVHVVTAFAVGHSITLALAAFGLVSVPTRVVESAIALSIVVSGIHAIRPLARGGETWIALGFGLVHGLAFAALLSDLDLSRGSLVTTLLGFNLGIELTQLIVVALVMPSLMLLSRTAIYPAVRVTLAVIGVVLAAAWLAERTTLITSNPLANVADSLVEHPFLICAALAGLAVAAWSISHLHDRWQPRVVG